MMRLQLPSAAPAARKSHDSHTPRARQTVVFAWSARRVRFASCCGGGRRSQLRHCAAFCKRHTMM
eukprot:11208095-Lingulodinium_polyedra.AAC.1